MDLEFAVAAKTRENLFEHTDCIARHLFAISQRGRAFSIPLVDILKTSSFKKSLPHVLTVETRYFFTL